jgi:UDP-N-acetylglucosamine 2-epimerase (non-hydrolysing)
VAIVYGTRPEAVKIAPLWRALKATPGLEPLLISTGQHRDMLAEIHDWFGMEPDLDLALMTEGQDLAGLTARVMTTLTRELQQLQVAAVVVHGDTTTSMAGAMAARFAGIPVIHLEAGLRTHDLLSPFPEELNRRLTGVMADLHLAPTERARRNLLAEGVSDSDIVVTGNTVIDSLLETAQRAEPIGDTNVQNAIANARKVVVATLHRRESHGEPLRRVGQALADLTQRVEGTVVVLPLHPNPKVRASIGEIIDNCDDIVVCSPMPYPQFVSLLNSADLIVTDSGGIQEEAPSLDKPVLVVRDSTERPEAIEAGTARLVGTDPTVLIEHATTLLEDPSSHQQVARIRNPFGDGTAAQQGASAIANLLAGSSSTAEPIPASASSSVA